MLIQLSSWNKTLGLISKADPPVLMLFYNASCTGVVMWTVSVVDQAFRPMLPSLPFVALATCRPSFPAIKKFASS